ncbi:uncharacterized protein FIBRA_05836 [Fibroporia radiculosa]|uniref:DNA polymerase V n=1 Tax=Fibroporia radiculosa TaxID=599839 RepID=J4IAX9_9APHY|nr:uncharacterized protein FIBRA_05836 [Fibroporia radiculosa]CCM03691.1 predicted protein [Fibroporia radiculosa]
MSTTLPLFWDLSSSSKPARIDASVKLVSALEHFQAQFVPKASPETSDDEDEDEESKDHSLDNLNAQDVSYSIRRLVRGLASPRESSRLGFAVALTELLSRINTVSCAQIITLIYDSSRMQGSMSGQEERDMHFARLFGLTAVIQSGLLLRDTPLPTSASSATLASSLSSYTDVLANLLALAEKKSWLRESAWWTVGLAVDALNSCDVPWKEDAIEATINIICVQSKGWTPEKLALTAKLQSQYPSRDWRKLLSPTFKHPDLLSTGNLSTIARVLKESNPDDDEETDVPKSGAWRPQVHFVWDILLDGVLADPSSGPAVKGSFPEFFRIVVDESLFASTSSPQRKYWGFQVFQKALPRVSSADMPMLFTKNFMRSWINHLSNSDRYLHKAAKQVATDVQAIVKNNPTLGFTLILQLTGVHGSRQFDKLTKTKTVESILTSMDNAGIQNYIDYLLKQANDEQSSDSDAQTTNARRAWIIDQLAALVRNGAIPKSDDWVQSILDWFVVHGLFLIVKSSEKNPIGALRTLSSPPFSDELAKSCRERLLSCLAELTGQATVVSGGDKAVKVPAVASDGEFWIQRVLCTIGELEKDTKHVRTLDDVDEEQQQLRIKARQTVERLRKVPDDQREAAKGAELLLSATLLHHYCADDEADPESLESCIDGASRMFPVESQKSKKKSRKSAGGSEGPTEAEALEPVDVLVDNVIGFLEQATAYMRSVANQVFSMLSGSVRESTVDLILTQLERRDPAELRADEDEDEDEDEGMGGGEGASDDESEEESGKDESSDEEEEEEDMDEAEALELRRKIEEALRINGVEAATGDTDDESEEELMDDEQMLAIDEQLAAAFRARTTDRKLGKDIDAQREATHFKNRVLDLVDIFIKKQVTNPLALRLILPLADLIVNTGPDEKQLADKATGILRSRIGKAKELPSGVDKAYAAQVLEELHSRARRTPSSDVLATLSQCSWFLSKVLQHQDVTEPILKAYRESLLDFVSRKASKLNGVFFQDFVRRHTDVAWGLRDDLSEAPGKAVNVYRQVQAYQILNTLINRFSVTDEHRNDFLACISQLCRTLHATISGACDPSSTHTPANLKELLKVGLTVVRQAKRVSSSPGELKSIWEPSEWANLAGKLAETDRFRSSTGLQTMCKQIAQMAGGESTSEKKKKGDKASDDVTGSKRKAGALVDGEAPVTEKAKRKKVKKA